MRKRKTRKCTKCNSTFDIQPGKKEAHKPCPCCGASPNLTRNKPSWREKYRDNHIPDSMQVTRSGATCGSEVIGDVLNGNLSTRHYT